MIDLKAYKEANKRAALLMVPVLPNEESRTFLGGYPLWPTDEPWPTEGAVECVFLGQIDLADLPFRPEGWPSSGILYFFHNPVFEDLTYEPTDAKIVYYASKDRQLTHRKPTRPITQGEIFNYAGDGLYLYGRLQEPSKSRDSLPKCGIGFAEFEDYHAGDWYGALASSYSRTEWPIVNAPLLKLSQDLHDAAKENRTDAANSVRLRLPFVRTDSAEQQAYGGAALIDPDGDRFRFFRNLQLSKNADREELAARYRTWPDTWGMLFFHALRIARPQQKEFLQNAGDLVAGKTILEADDWARHAFERDFSSAPDAAEKGAYLDWAREAFRTCAHAFPEWLEKAEEEQANQAKGEASLQRDAIHHVTDALCSLSDATLFGLSFADPDRLSELPLRWQETYLGECMSGQMFGYGFEIQSEVSANRDRALLASFSGSRSLTYGGDLKVWLASASLEPNRWQKVYAATAV